MRPAIVNPIIGDVEEILLLTLLLSIFILRVFLADYIAMGFGDLFTRVGFFFIAVGPFILATTLFF